MCYTRQQIRNERIKNLLNKEVAIIKYQTEYSTGIMIMTKSHYIKKLKKIHKVFKDSLTFECIKTFTEEDVRVYGDVL